MSALSVLATALLLYGISPEILTFNYAYLILGTSSSAPFIFSAVMNRVLILPLTTRFAQDALFFFFVHLAHELTAVKLGQWYFPAQSIGYLELVGIRFPVEEFVFWIVLSTAILLADYEYFIDDGR